MSLSSPDQRTRLTQVVLSLAQGGSESLARDIAVGVDSSRFSSSVCALDEGGPLLADLESAGIPVRILGRRSGFDWRLMPRLFRIFRRQRVHLVQTHHLAPLIYSAAAARLAGAELIHVDHDRFSYTPDRRRKLRIFAPLCSRIVVIGQDLRDFFVNEVGLAPSRLSVIHNGVDVRRFSPEIRATRAALGLPGEVRLIGHVGRLDPAKDHATLLRAFARVLTVHLRVHLVIVGDGLLRRELHDLAATLGISSHVHFLGLRSDVADLLPHFDAFALSSVNEGLPLALLEAMACARPITSTAVGDIPSVIRDGVTGLTFPPGDFNALAETLIALIERSDWATSLGQSARRLVQTSFSLQSTVEHYEALYSTLRPSPSVPSTQSPSRSLNRTGGSRHSR